jgi:hypothetical protein
MQDIEPKQHYKRQMLRMVMYTMQGMINSYFHVFQKYVCTKKHITPHTQIYMAQPSATSIVFKKIP